MESVKMKSFGIRVGRNPMTGILSKTVRRHRDNMQRWPGDNREADEAKGWQGPPVPERQGRRA